MILMPFEEYFCAKPTLYFIKFNNKASTRRLKRYIFALDNKTESGSEEMRTNTTQLKFLTAIQNILIAPIGVALAYFGFLTPGPPPLGSKSETAKIYLN